MAVMKIKIQARAIISIVNSAVIMPEKIEGKRPIFLTLYSWNLNVVGFGAVPGLEKLFGFSFFLSLPGASRC